MQKKKPNLLPPSSEAVFAMILMVGVLGIIIIGCIMALSGAR